MLTITPLIWLKQQRTSILYNVATRVRIIIIPHILITINRSLSTCQVKPKTIKLVFDDWLSLNQDNVSEWSDMSICGP
jgi:hypothetical protein